MIEVRNYIRKQIANAGFMIMVREFKVIYGGMRSVIGEPLGFHSDREAQYGNPDYEEGFEKIDLRIQYKFAPVQPMDVDEEVEGPGAGLMNEPKLN